MFVCACLCVVSPSVCVYTLLFSERVYTFLTLVMIERKNGSKGSVCVCVVRVAACVYEMDTESKREFWIVCVGEKPLLWWLCHVSL